MVTAHAPLLLALLLLPSVSAQSVEEGPFLYDTFPSNFMWSSATSSYQIEGAWDADGKGENIWDTFCRVSGNIADDSDGTVACDSYNKYSEDIKILKELGVSAYRFSISWARIQPTGTGTAVQAGINYYKALIAALKAENIMPVVTLFHWDLPQALEDHGGWLNETIADAFAEYARICYREFGSDVEYWVTLNEPWVIAWLGYGVGSKAPGIRDCPGTCPYTAGHNLIKAHAKAYHIYHDEFEATQKGKVGMSYNVGWNEPLDPNSDVDKAASDRALQFDMGWFAHPTQINGDYPDVMKQQVLERSLAQGFSQSRLPEFTDEEKRLNNKTNDYFGLNFYSGGFVTYENKSGILPPNYDNDKDTRGIADPNARTSGSSWLLVTPWAMRKVLVWIKEEYGNPPLLVTENGVSDNNGTLEDQHRIYYYTHYINQMLKAIKLDDCNVIGYTAWSLLDNFEWERGYLEQFGLTYVNFSDPARPRTLKDSGRFYAELIKNNGFVSGVEKLGSVGPWSMLLLVISCGIFYL